MQFVRWIRSRLGPVGSISSTAQVAALVVPPGAGPSPWAGELGRGQWRGVGIRPGSIAP